MELDVKKKKESLKVQLSQLMGLDTRSREERQKQEKILSVQANLEALEKEIEDGEKQFWREKLAKDAETVKGCLMKKSQLMEEIADLDAMVSGIRERVQREVPLRPYQISSSHSILLEKWVDVPKNVIPVIDLSPLQSVDARPVKVEIETERIRQELRIPCVNKELLARLQAQGWALAPGERWVEEKLDRSNSQFGPIVALPEILDPFFVDLSWKVRA